MPKIKTEKISEKLNENIKIAHLTMIQSIITRMGANSFNIKALSATLASAAIAVLSNTQNPSYIYAIAALIPIVLFALMDIQYLRQERAYRKLYEKIRTSSEIEAYNLDANRFKGGFCESINIAISWSLSLFYVALITSFVIFSFLIINPSPS